MFGYTEQRLSTRWTLILLSILTLSSFVASLLFGSVHLPVLGVLKTVMFHPDAMTKQILIHFRLPRTLCAFIVGGLLALSGALMQILLRNPLADPYVLGISGGSAFAALFAMLLGATAFLNLSAFLGGLVSVFLVFGLAQMKEGFSPLKLLLTGIVIAAGWSALITLILTIAPNQNLRGMLFWLMGDLAYAELSIWQPIVLIGGLLVSLFMAKSLNVLAQGELTAQSLGIHPKRLYVLLYLLSALLTASAVSLAGCIGFIGLIVPHMLRCISSSDHRFILPASVLLGGSFLMLADMLARTLFAPAQLPVGVITALMGVPVFLFLLRKGYVS